MDGESPEQTPVWARGDTFPSKPEGSEYGMIDGKGVHHTADTVDELADKVSKARGIDLVWTPDSDRLVVPESVSELYQVLLQRQENFAVIDASNGKRMTLLFGVVLLWCAYDAWRKYGQNLQALYTSQLTGLAAMILFIFGLLPLYEAWKTRRRHATSMSADIAQEVPEAQFEAWLERSKIPLTYFLLSCLLLIGIVQLAVDWQSSGIKPSILRAGMLKLQALNYLEISDGGARWRMLTAPLLHGNIIHLLMNAGGILYLGRRVESLARWPHLMIVFMTSAWVGGVASFYWIPDKMAVGASGGLMGLLGFMLVFEKMHSQLVPKPAQRRLLAGLVLMVIVGFLGMSFIDNAAHAGGLLAGMAYAGIVFPKSASFHRPKAITRDKIVGVCVILLLAIVCLWAVYKILG